MAIKSAGFLPNNLSNLYSSSSRKLDQTAGIQNRTETASCTFNASNVDTIELSQSQTNYVNLSKTRDQVLSDINKDKEVPFLDNLKEQINSGNYEVDPQKLAKIMLTNDK